VNLLTASYKKILPHPPLPPHPPPVCDKIFYSKMLLAKLYCLEGSSFNYAILVETVTTKKFNYIKKEKVISCGKVQYENTWLG
jgi:hypothetical protein